MLKDLHNIDFILWLMERREKSLLITNQPRYPDFIVMGAIIKFLKLHGGGLFNIVLID